MEDFIKLSARALLLIVPPVVVFTVISRLMAPLVRGAFLADFATVLVAGFCAAAVAVWIGGALWGR